MGENRIDALLASLPDTVRKRVEKLARGFAKRSDAKNQAELLDSVYRMLVAYRVASPLAGKSANLDKGLAYIALFCQTATAGMPESFDWTRAIESDPALAGVAVGQAESAVLLIAEGAGMAAGWPLALAAAVVVGAAVITSFRSAESDSWRIFRETTGEFLERHGNISVPPGRAASPGTPPPGEPPPTEPVRPPIPLRPSPVLGPATAVAIGAAASAGGQILAGAVAIKMLPKGTLYVIAAIAALWFFGRNRRAEG